MSGQTETRGFSDLTSATLGQATAEDGTRVVVIYPPGVEPVEGGFEQLRLEMMVRLARSAAHDFWEGSVVNEIMEDHALAGLHYLADAEANNLARLRADIERVSGDLDDLHERARVAEERLASYREAIEERQS